MTLTEDERKKIYQRINLMNKDRVKIEFYEFKDESLIIFEMLLDRIENLEDTINRINPIY